MHFPLPPLVLACLLLALCGAAPGAGRTGFAAAAPAGRTVTVHNNIPRRDTDGNILAVGDGDLRYFPHLEKFYLYGTKYQPCPEATAKEIESCYWFCGWRNMTFAVYSSDDLVAWTPESDDVLPQLHSHPVWNTSTMAFFEPSVVFNKATGMYVMWFVLQNNLRPHKGVRGQGCATSRSPTGPFVFVDPIPRTGQPPSADLYLWVDPDTEEAYMKHNGGAPAVPANFVSLLSANYTAIVATSPPMENNTYMEGGGIFKRDGRWYVTFGVGCCFCPFGGTSFLRVADDPIAGPWTPVRELNPLVPYAAHPPEPGNASCPQCCAHTRARPSHGQCHGVPAQQFGFAGVPLAGGGEAILYVGMRFGSAPDFTKTHDYQYWQPLSFDADGYAEPLVWVDNFTLTLGR